MHCYRVFALTIATWAVSAACGYADTPPRPNFLVLVTDDQRWDCLGCAGHPHLKTPNIDRLAADGVMFPNMFVTTSICCISRASLVTGRLCRNHHVGDFQTPLPPQILATSFPAALKNAGYRTGCFGKWGIGGLEPRQIFDVWDAWGGQGAFFHNVGGRRVHNSQFLADKAEAFLRTQPRDQPFCLIVDYKAPHEPYEPDPRDDGLFRDVSFPIPKTASAEFFNSQPEFLRKSLGRTRAERDFPTPDKYQEFVRQYLQCIAGVDRSVGQIMTVLNEQKLDDNTVVVFTSDNGFFLGERGLDHKWLMHEESIRVPLIVRDPRLPAERRGQRPTEIVLNIDIAPTLLDLSGWVGKQAMDGMSLRPLLAGQATQWRDAMFYEHHYEHDGSIPRTEGIRTADWKYITYFDLPSPFEELYDLKTDPREEHNLASGAKFRAQLNTMRAKYREQIAKLPPPVRQTNPPPKRPASPANSR